MILVVSLVDCNEVVEVTLAVLMVDSIDSEVVGMTVVVSLVDTIEVKGVTSLVDAIEVVAKSLRHLMQMSPRY